MNAKQYDIHLKGKKVKMIGDIGKLFLVDQGALSGSDLPISQIACPLTQA